MPKSASPKKAGAPKAKGAVRAKSGCYTCRIRRKKCDERPDEFGRCETCVRLHIQCLGFGAKRPDWLRENNNVVELRDKIKQFLASQGMIKGHSGSASSRSAEQEQTLQLADDPQRTPSGSPQSSGELLLSEDLSRGSLSSIRDHRETDSTMYTPSYPPSTSYDSIYPHSSSQSQLYLSRPDSPGFGHHQQDYNYPPETSFFLTSNATSLVVPWTASYQMHFTPEMYDGFEDTFDGLLDPMNSTSVVPDWSGPLLQHYMDTVCRMQYQLADMTRLPSIFNYLQSQNVARDGAILLATIHTEGGQSALVRQGHAKNRYDELVQAFKGSQGSYKGVHAMAALHIISAFLFDGGRGQWDYWMDVAYAYCHTILDNNIRFLNSRDALLNCNEEENFIVKTVFWFDVLASVTTMKPPHFRDIIHEIYDPEPQSGIYDPDDDCNSDKLSMMSIMGCENRILWALSEISALASWKTEQSQKGRLNFTHLVHKADSLERLLESSSQQQGNSDSYSQPEEEARHFASEVFRTAAIVYLRTVVSNDFRHVEDIKSAVKECVKTFMSFREHRTDVRHIVVRSTVFAVYLCGCFTDVPADLKALKDYLQEEGLMGNCRAAMELMNEVRASRKPAEPVRWREALHDAKMLLV